MDEIGFLTTKTEYIAELIDTITRLSANVYVGVTDLRMKEAWIPKETKERFGFQVCQLDDIIEDFSTYVHPDDLNEYQTAMLRRRQGYDLYEELNIRMQSVDKEYRLYSIHMDIIRDEHEEPVCLTVLFRDENVMPLIDAMTDLYAAARYITDIEEAIVKQEQFSVLMISIDGINNMNIVYGVRYVNQVLQNVALLFIYMMDMNKAVYRLEGAKFAFLLHDTQREELVEFERKVRETLKNDIYVDGKHVELKMMAGGIYLNKYQGDCASVRGQLSYAMIHSMNSHSGDLVIFNDEVRTNENMDLGLMRIIHQAVRASCDGFYVEYQPVVNARTGMIEGVEALVRWEKEPYGKVPPGMFIEWMENDPSMYELGNFVLRRALEECKEFVNLIPDFFVNVNVSARQMERHEFCQAVMDILWETGFPADHLCLELTERCKNLPIQVIEEVVGFFKGQGIRMAMDDYGTGSASSSIVLKVPMSEIKIDMTFIKDIMDEPKNQAMVESIVTFANKCGMTTCLEGVENEELEEYLKRYDATWFQGYRFSKPLGITALRDYCKEAMENCCK